MITAGHDSEFGLTKGNQVVSALDTIDYFESKAGKCFPDNLNCEIAINPVTSLKEFHSFTDELLKHVTDLGYGLIVKPVIKYPDACLKHPDAYVSGCNPDFSGYTMMENTAPDFKTMDGTRSLGGHIHIGDSIDPYSFARWMDLFVGLPLLALEPSNDRRKLYGKAGCLRVKPYGAEYRTLSNIWINSEERREFVWENTLKAVEACKRTDLFDLENWNEIPIAINTHNVDLASQIIDRTYHLGVSKCL
jgi:hypothetical protein